MCRAHDAAYDRRVTSLRLDEVERIVIGCGVRCGTGCEIDVHFWAYLVQQKKPKEFRAVFRSSSVNFCTSGVGYGCDSCPSPTLARATSLRRLRSFAGRSEPMGGRPVAVIPRCFADPPKINLWWPASITI